MAPTFLLGQRATSVSSRRRLTPGQRAALIAALSRVRSAYPAGGEQPVHIRVSTKPGDAEALAYARELARAIRDAGWAVDGIFRDPGSPAHAGVFIAVGDSNSPPGEARELQSVLEQSLGVAVLDRTKPALPPRSIEILVGHRP